jgi:hypothetical protein
MPLRCRVGEARRHLLRAEHVGSSRVISIISGRNERRSGGTESREGSGTDGRATASALLYERVRDPFRALIRRQLDLFERRGELMADVREAERAYRRR